MRVRFDRWLLFILATIATVWASAAQAQETFTPESSVAPASAQWLQDRRRAEGRGIRLGDLELHPGIGVEGGYDTNLFYANTNPVGSALLRVTPHLYLSTMGEERLQLGRTNTGPASTAPQSMVTFRGGLSASYYHFFSSLVNDNVEGDLNLGLTIAPGRPVSFGLYEQFGRSIRPFGQTFTGATDYARDQNVVGGRFTFSSRGGMLQASAGYSFGLDYFEGSAFAFGRSTTHTIDGMASWRFLPQTAILYDVRVAIQDYTDASASPSTLVTNNQRVRTRIGINGAFTTHFSMSAMVGYAAGFYSDGRSDEYESVDGQLEARWTVSQTVRAAFGYQREFNPSFVGNFYRVDQLYLDAQVLLGGSFLLGGRVAAGLNGFGAQIDRAGMPLGNTLTRSDIRAQASLFAEYRVNDWFGVNTSLVYTGDFTDFQYRTTAPTGVTSLVPAGYNKFEIWLGVRAFY